MPDQTSSILLQSILEPLELPDSAYQQAADRYESLGNWLCRDNSSCGSYNPHVFPQGSFRLGTAIRPLHAREEYDLDLACELTVGIAKHSHTQRSVKALVGAEIESYRLAHDMNSPAEEKHRCWRLDYADRLSFHMDIVPCIPETDVRRLAIKEAMIRAGAGSDLAGLVSGLTVSLTDDRHPRYRQICDDWHISNPEGYARWFESRIRLASSVLLERAAVLKAASIDDVPVYTWKTPLQQTVQLLKRHRDQMFRDDPDVAPISVIVTTLAGRAYAGEADIAYALRAVLSQIEGLVATGTPRIPNPVDPNEDFADRWARPEGRQLQLEANFWNWVRQAKTDFGIVDGADDADFIAEQASQKFALALSASALSQRLGLWGTSRRSVTPKVHVISGEPAKPWRMADP
jgi:hypothetical protein